MNRLKFVLTAALAVLLALPGTGLAAAQKIYARVNGTELTQIYYNEAFNQIIPMSSFHRLTRDKLAQFEPQIIEKMVENELYYQEAVRTGIKMPEDQLAREKQYIIGKTGGPRGFDIWLSKNGVSAGQYWALLERGWLINALQKREIDDKSAVSDQEARAYYEKKKKTFFRPEARRISEISFSVDPAAPDSVWQQKEKYAEGILDKIRKGADFGTMAWDYSEDDWRVKEGDRGIVHQGTLEDEDYEKQIFQLKEGQISGVIKTLYGYNIVKVTQIIPPQQLSFDEVKQSIIDDIQGGRKQQLADALLSRLKKQAKIEILDGK